MTSTPAEFGFTRWGAEIVRLAEPISARGPNASAPRARSVARNGGVTLTVDGRSVSGLVQRGGEASMAHLEFDAMSPATATTCKANAMLKSAARAIGRDLRLAMRASCIAGRK